MDWIAAKVLLRKNLSERQLELFSRAGQAWICVGAGEIAQNFTLSVGVNEIWTRKTLQDHWPHLYAVLRCVYGMPAALYNIHTKGGLISESFFHWLQSPKECAKHCSEHLLYSLGDRPQDKDFGHFLGDSSQSEKISEITPPLLS